MNCDYRDTLLESSYINELFINDINNNNENIIKWAHRNNLNETIIINYLKNYQLIYFIIVYIIFLMIMML